MSSVSYYRNQVEASQKKIAALQKKKSDLSKKAADLQSKIAASSKRATTTKSPSTMRMKRTEAESKSRDLGVTQGKIADVEKKLATEQKKLSSAEQALARAQAEESKRQLEAIDDQFQDQNRKHAVIMSEIERLKQLPEEITVLFLAANPLDLIQLGLDEEVRSIENTIRKSKHRDVVKLQSRWANRPPDVLQAINELDPTIIHFSGHGSKEDEIVFQDDQGNAKLVRKEAIVQMMMACSGSIRLVFFNTCYSHNQAKAVVEHVEVAIGMTTKIGDDAARVFASQFYSGIGFGHSVGKAFRQAKALLMMEGIPEENTPELFEAQGLSADNIVLVRPEPSELAKA